ncbi:thioredoxin family protein [Flavobacterium ovatum]|uniref:thioredoxin family protein n=1 Tax=Flavobacterium ovatum TaxID=1928857 RepID=UPI00344D3523
MKTTIKHTFIFIILLFTATVNAQKTTIDFIQNDIQSAVVESKATKKNIFVMVYASWCVHCNKMKSTVLTDPAVITFFNDNFVNVMMDSETLQGKEFMKRFNIKSYPTYVFLDEKETHIYSSGGEFTSEAFIIEGQKALNPYNQLPFLEKQFNQDRSNPDKCFAYLYTLKKSIDAEKSDEVTGQFLATQSKEQLFTPMNWKIVAYGVNDLNSKSFDLMVNHQADFAKVSSPKRVETKIVDVVKRTFATSMNSLDSINYSKTRIIAKNIKLSKVDSLVFRNDLQMYEGIKNWKKYQETTLESVSKFAWSDYSILNGITKNYNSYINETESLKTAISWAKRAVELNNSAETILLLARLHHKIGDKKAAIENARNAKATIVAMGWSTKEIDAFYGELGIK